MPPSIQSNVPISLSIDQSMEIVRLLLLLSLLLLFSVADDVNTINPGCPSACGDIAVPYPFGIGPNCAMSSGFELECKGYDKLFVGDIEFYNINLTSGQAGIYYHMSSTCYTGGVDKSYRGIHNVKSNRTIPNVKSNRTIPHDLVLDFRNYTYRFSYTLNKFITIGCGTIAYIVKDEEDGGYQSGCLSVCPSTESIAGASSCSGIGCCQTSIPKGLNYYGVAFDDRFSDERVNENLTTCGYAFLTEEASFVFDPHHIINDDMSEFGDKLPLVLDWAIGNETCEAARANSTSYACHSENSDCVDSTNGPGYRCNCSTGYQGNPYLLHGCQDTNECDHQEKYPCYGICNNIEGSFSCTCPIGTEGDPLKKEGCTCKSGTEGDPLTQGGCKKLGSKIIPTWLGFIIGLLCTFVLATFAHLVYERVKLMRAKRKCFKQNGGLLLQEQINAHQGVKFKIFTIEEIRRATDNFDARRVLGEGGHGLVYRGSLADDREVAIKISRITDQKQKKDFAKEMYIGSLINHRNVVNILGCCLEVEVPLLVYEFVPKGDLFNHIHIKKGLIPLDFRLKVARESAAALAYLHSDASPPILHGDVKSSNILLDELYSPKVSDFGTSLLDKDQMATHAQGTLGYIDPEYAQTCMLTDKSDVYSFAVVLLELFTRKRVVLSDQSGVKIGLVSVFLSSVRENRFRELLDSDIRDELGNDQVEEMANMLVRCLSPSGESRPAMKEVAAWAERLTKCVRPSSSSWKTNDLKLDEGNVMMKSGESSSSIWAADSTESRMAFSISSGRY